MNTCPTQLLCAALNGHGIASCGVAITSADLCGKEVIDADGKDVIVSHDGRNAPLLMDAGGHELHDFLVSITDEQDTRMLAWMRRGVGSAIVGLGIDLCSTTDFASDERGDHFARLLLTNGERKLLDCDDSSLPLRRAQTFAAKEAAFKAASAPLRRWYETHDSELAFDVRDFELWPNGIVRGTARSGRAARACHMLGINRIEASFSEYKGMALCVAVALT